MKYRQSRPEFQPRTVAWGAFQVWGRRAFVAATGGRGAGRHRRCGRPAHARLVHAHEDNPLGALPTRPGASDAGYGRPAYGMVPDQRIAVTRRGTPGRDASTIWPLPAHIATWYTAFGSEGSSDQNTRSPGRRSA